MIVHHNSIQVWFGAMLLAGALGAAADIVAGAGQGARPNALVLSQQHGMHGAVESGDHARVRQILEGSDPSWRNAVDYCGRTALASAAAHGHAEIVRDILGYSDEDMLNHVDFYGQTVLHEAARSDHEPTINAILDAPGFRKFDAQDNHGCTAVHLAVECSNFVAMRLLLNCENIQHVDLHDHTGCTPLHSAANWGMREAAEHIMQAEEKYGALEMYNERGLTALHQAVLSGHRDAASVVNVLLGGGFRTTRKRKQPDGVGLDDVQDADSDGDSDDAPLLWRSVDPNRGCSLAVTVGTPGMSDALRDHETL